MRSISQIPATFAYQSIPNASGPNGLLSQPPGNPIVDSTRQYAQTGGVGVALHSGSQSPVAIRFKGGEADSSVVTLTPGQKTFTGTFSEFEWGLPFGWLGGGHVVLYVLHREKVDLAFPSVRAPIIFHRQTIVIQAANPLIVPNLPLAFPWANAAASVGGNLQPQGAGPVFSIDPDVTLLISRATPPDPNSFFAVWDGLVEVDNDNVLVEYELSFPIVPANASIIWLPTELAKLGGDGAILSFVNSAGLSGALVDVIRYGRLM